MLNGDPMLTTGLVGPTGWPGARGQAMGADDAASEWHEKVIGILKSFADAKLDHEATGEDRDLF
jgi:hypothetical protein